MFSWKKTTKDDLIGLSNRGELPKLSKNELLNQLSFSVENADFKSVSNLLTYFILKREISHVKKHLRITKYTQCNKFVITNVLKNLIVENDEFYSYLTNEEKAYLVSLFYFSKLQPSVYKLHRLIEQEMSAFRQKYPQASFIKSVMAWIDAIFLYNYYPNYQEGSWRKFTKEQLAAAISYLIYLYTDRYDKDYNSQSQVESSYVCSNSFLELLKNICIFQDLKEKEIQLELYQYTCRHEKEDIIFYAVDDNFEKSIRLGYIRTEINSNNNSFFSREDFNQKSQLSLYEFVSNSISQLGREYFRFDNNLQEAKFVLDENLANQYSLLLDNIYSSQKWYREEWEYLGYLVTDHTVAIDELFSTRIREEKTLTFGTFLNIKRVFTIYFYLFPNRLSIQNKFTPDLLKSLIPQVQFDYFKYLISNICSPDELREFLEILTWDPESTEFLDIQYTPLLLIDKASYLFSPTIMASSNHIRNLQALENSRNNKKLNRDGKKDFLKDKLVSVLTDKGYETFTDVDIEGTDIDILTIIDNTAFIFECKNGLHPIDWFSLRNTFEYLKTAEGQLNKIRSYISSGAFEKNFKSKFITDISKIRDWKFSTITTTRVFNGNFVFSYPIRNINEIIQFIDAGNIETESKIYNLWKGSIMTSDDLIDYLGSNNLVFKTFYDNLKVRYDGDTFFQTKIFTKTFWIDDLIELKNLFENLCSSNYRIIKNK